MASEERYIELMLEVARDPKKAEAVQKRLKELKDARAAHDEAQRALQQERQAHLEALNAFETKKRELERREANVTRRENEVHAKIAKLKEK